MTLLETEFTHQLSSIMNTFLELNAVSKTA
jgi:hypothetical protein